MDRRSARTLITAVDTNVLVALWDRDRALSLSAQVALDAALERGRLVVSAPVFAELMAAPSRDELFIDTFFRDTGIEVDWRLSESIWRAAGQAFQAYAARRKRQRDAGPRRILADFLIGSHALQSGYTLLTLDRRFYRSVFPGLTVAVP